MTSPSRGQTGTRYGPAPRWGEKRDPVKIHWPASHRVVYEAEADARGLSLNELVIRDMHEARIPFPRAHREILESLAAAEGLSLSEFVMREMADRFGLPAAQPDESGGPQQLRLGA